MAKRYARLNWNSTSTYVSPDNLNKMDKGIDDCDNAIETLNTQVNTLNNNLGAELSTGVSGGNAFTIPANTRQSICEWIIITPGTYLINANAAAHSNTEYFIRNANNNTILKACNNTGSITFMIVASEELVLDFCATPTTDYTIYADARYNYLQVIRLK